MLGLYTPVVFRIVHQYITNTYHTSSSRPLVNHSLRPSHHLTALSMSVKQAHLRFRRQTEHHSHHRLTSTPLVNCLPHLDRAFQRHPHYLDVQHSSLQKCLRHSFNNSTKASSTRLAEILAIDRRSTQHHSHHTQKPMSISSSPMVPRLQPSKSKSRQRKNPR